MTRPIVNMKTVPTLTLEGADIKAECLGFVHVTLTTSMLLFGPGSGEAHDEGDVCNGARLPGVLPAGAIAALDADVGVELECKVRAGATFGENVNVAFDCAIVGPHAIVSATGPTMVRQCLAPQRIQAMATMMLTAAKLSL